MLSTAIPYRTDPVVGGGELAWIVLVTICLLVAVLVVLTQLRRKGWLERLADRAPIGARPAGRRWLVQSQRISRRASAHTLTCDGLTVLVVESATGVAVTVLPVIQGQGVNADGEASRCV